MKTVKVWNENTILKACVAPDDAPEGDTTKLDLASARAWANVVPNNPHGLFLRIAGRNALDALSEEA